MDTAVVSEILTLNINRNFNASREAVFDAWTTAEAICQWFAPDPTMTTTVEKLDLKVGGRYQFLMQEQSGDKFIVNGEYVSINRSEQLVFTWQWTHEPDIPGMLVTIDFIEKGEHTEMLLTHERLPNAASRDHHSEGWVGCFVRLEQLLIS